MVSPKIDRSANVVFGIVLFQCVDLQNDPDNCGSCGHPCASHVCSAGVCQ